MKSNIYFATAVAILSSFLVYSQGNAQVLFQDGFDASPDWSVTQPVGSTQACSTSCGIPGGWTGYYNGACKLDGVPGEPGNNLLYIDQYAGYPNETNTCYGGSGKCLTFWTESGVADMADGQLTYFLDREYEDIYLRFRMRWKSGFEYSDESITKLFHIQHYSDGSPHAYFGSNPGNQPVVSGGFTNYGSNFQFYVEGRCQINYYCHTVVPFNLTTVSGAYDGNWHTLEIRVRRNSSIGVADGIIEVWWDGGKKNPVPGYYNTNYPFNDSGSPELRGWRYVMIAGNTNNYWDTSCSNMADCEQWYAIDDVVVSTRYIGPGDTQPPPPPPLPDEAPSPPAGLTIME